MSKILSQAAKQWWTRLVPGQRSCTVIRMDSAGRTPELGSDGSAVGDAGQDVCLLLPPGLVVLRRLEAQGLDEKSLLASLRLHAEETLAADLDEYYVDTWLISEREAGLAAIPNKPLRRARRHLARQHLSIARVLVPELQLPTMRPGSGLAVWDCGGERLLCLWQSGRLSNWLALPRDIAVEAVLDFVASISPAAPQWIAMEEGGASDPDLRAALEQAWPRAEVVAAPGDSLDPAAAYDGALEFKAFLQEQAARPASTRQKWRLALMFGAVLVSGLFFLFAEVRHLENQLEWLRHQVSLSKVKANRSGQIAARISQAVEELGELKPMTVERRGVLYVLKALRNALPGRVKLVSMSLERRGGVALEGIADTEAEITLLLGELGRSPVFADPRLTFTQKEGRAQVGSSGASLRFRVEARLPKPLGWFPQGAEEG